MQTEPNIYIQSRVNCLFRLQINREVREIWKIILCDPYAKLPRSRSSPSPPPSRIVAGRGDATRKQAQGRATRQRLNSASSSTTVRPDTELLRPASDWSTSYQAGSSSSASRSSSDDSETEDEPSSTLRGRAFSQTRQKDSPNGHLNAASPSSIRRRHSPLAGSSGDSAGGGSGLLSPRIAFTRSRSPAVISKSLTRGHRHLSPSLSHAARNRTATLEPDIVFPRMLEFRIRFLPTPWAWAFSADMRKCGESWIILGAVLYGTFALSDLPQLRTSDLETCKWIVLELLILAGATVFYSIWTHSTFSPPKHAQSPTPAISLLSSPLSTQQAISSSPRPHDGREQRRSSTLAFTMSQKKNFGFIWMSVPKNYRQSLDDGMFTGLLLGPLISSALLVSALRLSSSHAPTLPHGWRIEAPAELHRSHASFSALEALVLSRYSLVDLGTFCSTILLFHACASWLIEAKYRKVVDSPEGERASVPRSERLRTSYYVIFTFCVSIGAIGLKVWFQIMAFKIWHHLNYIELAFSSLFYQFSLYTAIRLAHRGFTLGELGLVSFGGTALCMEFLNFTIARIWPATMPFIKTYRLPTPLLIFQMALIAGSFLTGFLLSPFLVLSRRIAQQPVRRLRFPQDKQRHRRSLAVAFYIGSVLIVGGVIGMWTRWCLGRRDPWLWVMFYILEGRRKWSRPALLAYWASLGCISVAGWNRQLARSRRYRTRTTAGENVIVPGALDIPSQAAVDSMGMPTSPTLQPSPAISSTLGLTFSNLPTLPNASNVSNVAADLFDAADKRVPTLGLNARRKFFHALAVVMFIPGVALDPAFAHLSFSAAFALFTFTEYVRYFAIYPFGASVHLFMNEFLDHKDGGTAILSHFYLLTGCAGSVWLEGPTQLLQFTGILTVGVGDALASIVGKRVGKHRWSSSTSKTLEGSAAFTISIVACAWILRLCGYAESFSSLGYTGVVALASVLEALSDQNDNLTLPLFMWSMLVLADI